MKKNLILFAIMLMITSSLFAKEGVTFKFSYPNLGNKKVVLITKDGEHEMTLDDKFTTQVTLKEVPTGYAAVRFGNSQMTIYMQDGCDLGMNFEKKEGQSRPRPLFSGAISAENDFLCNSNGYVKPVMSGCKTPQDVMKAIDYAVEQNMKIVDSKPLSKDFIKLERERVRYETLLSYTSYSQWNPSVFPYLKNKMVNNEDLLEMSEYKKFLKEALSTRGFENMPQFNAYKHAEDQLAIITDEFKNSEVAEYLVVTVLSEYLNRRGVEQMDKFNEIYKGVVKSEEYKAPYDKLYAKWWRVSKGQPCPDFKYESVDGKFYTPKDFRGKYVFIDCWATWCGPCLAQLKPLGELEHLYASKDIIFVSISSDEDKAKWQKMVKDKNMGGVQLIQDRGNQSFNEAFMINGIPRFILLDKNGNVYDANMSRPSEPATKALLDKLLL